MFLDRITRRPGHVGEGFPWTVRLIAGLRDLQLTAAAIDPTLASAERFLEGFVFSRNAKAYTRLFLPAEWDDLEHVE